MVADSKIKMQNNKYYLNIGRASDLTNEKERIIYRFFEILPGVLIWITLIGMVILSWLKPDWAAIFIITFCIFTLFRVFNFTVHLLAAYNKMQYHLEIDWLKQLETLSARRWKELYHLIILPMYREDLKVVRETFQALVNSRYPKQRMIVVLAIEARAGTPAASVARAISSEFGDKFYKFMVSHHPSNIPGEIAGKGSNETWAARKAKQKIIDPAGIPYQNIIVSTFDIDTQVYPQYFACLSYHYLTCPYSQRASFQPLPLYMNNIWEAPFFSRVVASSNVFWQAIQQQRPEKIVTYSSHSMSFKAAVEMNYWQTNVVSEDAGIFWKSFLFYDGHYQVVPLHFPISMDCVQGKNLKQTIIAQYKQQRRWAWGVEGIPYLWFGFLQNKKIPFRRKFSYLFMVVEGFWSWATASFLILCLGWLPLLLGGERFGSELLAYHLPRLTGIIMTLALIGLIINAILYFHLLTPRPPHCPVWKTWSMLFQWIFYPLTFIIFGSIPAIDAQTRLMLGKYLGFVVTEKTR